MLDLTKDLTSILSDLISIKSETGYEKEICDLLHNKLKGYHGELIRVKDSLVFNLNLGFEKRVALVGHTDTVPVAGSSTTPTIKNGELWGRGACDMKSGIACMLKVIEDISTGKISPKYNLSFVFYENEEGALPNGVNFLLDNKNLQNIDFAFILEPTEGKYSVGCLGALCIQKEVLGISAHSANPKKGLNAIDESLEIYQRVKDLNSEINAIQSIDGLEFYETVNITTFNTLNKTFNVIPSKVEMIANYRFSPNMTLEEATNRLLHCMGSDNTLLLDNAESCYIGNSGDEFLKPGIEKEIMQAWTDIAQLNKAGIPAINYGAGSIKYAHKPDERISIEELNEFYLKLVSHL